MSGALIATAQADPYGELTRFGSPGSGHGQFVENTNVTVAFGVDPTNNTVYVGDEPEPGRFRIQKLDSTGKFIAEAHFQFKGSEEPGNGIEGIAVDPATTAHPEGRVYILGVQERREQNVAETVPDPETPAAGSLYALKTAQNGEKLEPAAGTKVNPVTTLKEGLLTSLRGASETRGVPLLEPGGLAVDPTTHDVVLGGKEDRGETSEPALRVALERVSAAGAIGERYVDTGSPAFFEESEEATSPVVSAAGKVYIVGGELELGASETEVIAGEQKSEQIDEIPSGFKSGEAPTPIVKFHTGPHELVSFPGSPAPIYGGGLSLGPDGTFYAYANIKHEEPAETFTYARGVLSFDATGKEKGWTGGQTWFTKAGTIPCAISFQNHPVVAAGGEGHVFVFDSNPEAPSVIEFGAGGSGCPTSSVTTPTATISGEVVGTEANPVTPNTEVLFSSEVHQANAIAVKWDFGDGTQSETVNQHQITEVTHKFAHEGTYTVSETVEGDNLASLPLKASMKITVAPKPPVAAFNAKPTPGVVGQAVEFSAKNSSDPNGEAITKYSWVFGDGKSEVTTTPTAAHVYGAAASYEVRLTVTDALGLTSPAVVHTLTVVPPPPPPPPPPPVETPAPQPTTPTGPPSGGVLSYQISVVGTSLSVSKSGALSIKVSCAGQSSCTGSVTLRTLGPVSTGGKHKAILTLTSGSFTLAGGQTKTLTLHLSAKARQLLARSHVLKARASITARDHAGVSHTTTTVVTLRLKKH